MEQQSQGARIHPLLGKFDLDPGRYRPMYYGLELDIPAAIGGRAQGTIKINNQPFILTRITHKIIGDTADPETSGLYQDGQYDLDWRDEQSNYQNQPIAADLMFGTFGGMGNSNHLMELPFPLPYPGSKVFSFTVINRVLRTPAPERTLYTVGICLHGIADWGEILPNLQPSQR